MQLRYKGTNASFVDHIENDANNLALLKRHSRNFVERGSELSDDRRYRSGRSRPQKHIQEAMKAIESFSKDVKEKLAALDQINRDNLQLVRPQRCYLGTPPWLTSS